MPENTSHSVMDKPEPVNLVNPPIHIKETNKSIVLINHKLI